MAPSSSEACVQFCVTHPENCVNDPCPEGGQTDSICCAIDESGVWCGSTCCTGGQSCGLDGSCCPALDPATCPYGTTTDGNDCPICMDNVDCEPSIAECTEWCTTHPDECISGCTLERINGPLTGPGTSCPGRTQYSCYITYTDADGWPCDGCWLGIVCLD